MALCLYRKYRPMTFTQVWGQEHITKTLTNSIRAHTPHHAYLFIGTRGTGKTTVARILSRAINCLSPIDGNPCNVCASCKLALDEATHDIKEIDAATYRGVESIEELVETARYLPTALRYKVYILDEVHQLSSVAKDALLKTLEEPPLHVVFILATTVGSKVPPTIRTRCMLFDFRNATDVSTAGLLRAVLTKEKIPYEEDGLLKVASLARGSYRDALSIADGVVAGAECVTLASVLESQAIPDRSQILPLAKAIILGDVNSALTAVDTITRVGIPVDTLIVELTELLLTVARKSAASGTYVYDLSPSNVILITSQLRAFVKDYAGESPYAVLGTAVVNATMQASKLREIK